MSFLGPFQGGRLAPSFLLLLLALAEFSSQKGGVGVDASFIGGQAGIGLSKATASLTRQNLQSKYLATPAQSSRLGYRPLADDLLSEQTAPRGYYANDVDALKALLDETVAVYMDRAKLAQMPQQGGTPETTSSTQNSDQQAQEIQNLIQEMNQALQYWQNKDITTSDDNDSKAKIEQGTRFEVSLLLEQATRRYVDAVNRGDQEAATLQHERMQELAAQFKNLPSSESANAKRRSETTSLASFQARLEDIKKQLPQAATTANEGHEPVQVVPEYQNRKMQSTGKPKAGLPEIVFCKGDIPDPEWLQEMLYQATVLFDRCDNGPISTEVQELVGDIGHVLYYATQAHEKAATAEEEGTRTRLKVAQEVEAALQLHMKIGDELSEEILRELAAEFRTTAPPPGSVSSAAVVGALQERIDGLQQKVGVVPTKTQQQASMEEEAEEEASKETSVPSKWDRWSQLSAEERRCQTSQLSESTTEDLVAATEDTKGPDDSLQKLLDRSTLLLTKSGLSEQALEHIQTLVEDIAQALYLEISVAGGSTGESPLLALQSRLETLEQQIHSGLATTPAAPVEGKSQDILPSALSDKEKGTQPKSPTSNAAPSVEPVMPMVDNSTLIGSITDSSVPSKPVENDTPKSMKQKESSDALESSRKSLDDATPKAPSNSVAKEKKTPNEVKTPTGQGSGQGVDQSSLETWLDETGATASPKQSDTTSNISKEPPSPKTPSEPKSVEKVASSSKSKPAPVLSDGEWNESVRNDLKMLYENAQKTNSEDKTPWQRSIESDLGVLHGLDPMEVEPSVPTDSKEDVAVAAPAVSKEDVPKDVLDALSEAESALEYADTADVSISDRINEKMGGIVSKTTDTMLDVTFRGAFYFFTKALDAASPSASEVKSEGSSSGLLDVFKPKKKKEPKKPSTQSKDTGNNNAASVPFFATVKKPEKSREELFTPQPPDVPPPVGDEDPSPSTNSTSAKSKGLSSHPHNDDELGAFESSRIAPALQGFTKLFGPKSSLFPTNKKDDEEDPPSREELLPSTTLFYQSHTLLPQLSTRGLLSQAVGTNGGIASMKLRQVPLATMVGALVYPFLLRQVRPSLLLGAVFVHCMWMLRQKGSSV